MFDAFEMLRRLQAIHEARLWCATCQRTQELNESMIYRCFNVRNWIPEFSLSWAEQDSNVSGAEMHLSAQFAQEGVSKGSNPAILNLNSLRTEGAIVIRGVFVGLSTIDIIYEVDEFPLPDSKIAARSQAVHAGGPATNAAITFRHLGGEAALAVAIGHHPLTALVRDELETYGVKLLDLSPDRAEAPAISSVAVNPAGQRNVISANATGIGEYSDRVDQELLDSASIVMIDGHLMRACIEWAQAARERSIAVVLDGGSWKPGTELLLPHVDTAICSADFLPPGCDGHEQVIEFLEDHGTRKIAITAGARPIRFVSEQETGFIPVPEVAAVDTMGAGDIFHGAYSYYATAGISFTDALAKAASIASNSCRFRGTRAWMGR